MGKVREGPRDRRRHTAVDGDGYSRTPAERDRDRILYSAEFRRLAEITQVASSDVGTPLHNRLTHVLKVAQVGRRAAQRILRDPKQSKIAAKVGGICPDVVEAACLAHDLGHPPFGHIAEEVLNEEVTKLSVHDGFEGNAQSFRIVTKLAEHSNDYHGLNLTRATLDAIMKYPWTRGTSGKKSKKWAVYSTEEDDMAFGRELDGVKDRKCLEAEIMDWADDIAYSIHDLVDFYQAGKIPLERLIEGGEEVKRFTEGTFAIWRQRNFHEDEDFEGYRQSIYGLLDDFPFSIDRAYCGDQDQRQGLHQLTAVLIARYVNGITVQIPASAGDSFVRMHPSLANEIVMLKELTWHYVIRNPSLATQQYGQRKIIKELFHIYNALLQDERQWYVLPDRFHQIAGADEVSAAENVEQRARLACDIISSMNERQAVAMYHRLTGIAPGAALATILS